MDRQGNVSGQLQSLHLSEETLADYVAGRCGPVTDAKVEAHVARCSHCATALREAAQLELLFEQAAAEIEPRPMAAVATFAGETSGDEARRPMAVAPPGRHWSQSLSAWAVAASVATLTFATQVPGGPFAGAMVGTGLGGHGAHSRVLSRVSPGTGAGDLDEFPACGSGFSLATLVEYPACELPWSLAELGGEEQSLVAHALGLVDLARLGDELPEFCSWDDVPRSFPGEPVCLWPSSSG